MRRALIVLALLPGSAVDPAEAARAQAVAPRASVRVPLELSVDGRTVGRGVALVDGSRLHVALRDPLGRPIAVVRAQHGAVGVQRPGGPEIVAADADLALASFTGGLDLEDLGRLLLGAAPRGLGALTAEPGGWSAVGPHAELHLDPAGQVRAGRVGEVRVTREAGGLTLSDGRTSVRVRAGVPEAAAFPDAAFTVGGPGSTLISAERFAADVISR